MPTRIPTTLTKFTFVCGEPSAMCLTGKSYIRNVEIKDGRMRVDIFAADYYHAVELLKRSFFGIYKGEQNE